MPDMPDVQFVTTSDGVEIACTDTGGPGPTLVWTPGWVSHLEHDWGLSDPAAFYKRLAANHRLIQFDGRGTGLSDRDVEDLSVEARVRDIEAVADGLALEAFDLFGWSEWGPVAIIYAGHHPERLRRLALYATFARFQSTRQDLGQALLALIRAEWSVGSRMITGFVHPDADHEHERQYAQYFRDSASGEVAAKILEEGFFRANVTEQAKQVTVPTLVMHRRDDPAAAYEGGRRLAGLINGARFVPLAGRVHVPWHGDVEAFLDALEGFFDLTPAPAPAIATPAAEPAATHSAPVTIFFNDIAGSTAMTGRLGDAESQEVLAEHNAIVREALLSHGGTEVKHTGDGIMAWFASATGAVQCAIDIQRAFAARNQAQPDHPIQVRIGLNAGEPVRDQHDLFGTSVQLARRICDQGEADQILASNVVRELVAGKGFLFAEVGEVALRGFEDPVRLYEVRWAE